LILLVELISQLIGVNIFLKKTVEFFGHIVSNGCVQKQKIDAVKHFPELKTIWQAFLDLTGYFHKFILKYVDCATVKSIC